MDDTGAGIHSADWICFKHLSYIFMEQNTPILKDIPCAR